MSENESSSMVTIHTRYIYIYMEWESGRREEKKEERNEKRKIEEQRRRRIRTKFLAHISRLLSVRLPYSRVAGPL